jgi:arylsulfatase A-like enzyme
MRPILALTLLLVAACGQGEPQRPQADWGDVRPPNVVVVLLDTLRADALSTYGAVRRTAPFMARLAEDSTLFEHAWSTSSWTAPATASVLTGCYPDRHGVTSGFLAHFRDEDDGSMSEAELEQLELRAIARNAPTLAERFRRLGYVTLGMASNVNIGHEMEFDRGFDRFERHHQESVKQLRQRLLEWEGELNGEGPSFLYLHLNDVHEPYDPRPRFYLPPEDDQDANAVAYALYESEIGFLDSFLARLYEDLGWGKDTLLVLVADHGEEFLDHGQNGHGFSLFGELTRVPLLIHGPSLGVRPGRFAENVSLVDLLPTLFDLIGRPVDDTDGRSLADWCRHTDKSPGQEQRRQYAERPLFLHRIDDGKQLWGLVFERWKLIQGPGGRCLLFDTIADPGEQTDLAPREPERVERLLSLLDAHRERGMTPDSKRAKVTIDDEMLDTLKGLGYVK